MNSSIYRLLATIFAAVVLGCCAPSPVQATTVECGDTVNNNNFNHYQGSYRAWTPDDVLCDYPRGGPRPSGDGVERKPGFIFVKGVQERGDRAAVGEGLLRMEHPEGCVGTSEGSGCGILYSVRLPQPLEHATLSYKFKFDSDYHWTRGGKLPGMCDHDCPTGCQANSIEGGWSSRVMWRDEGKYLPPQDDEGIDTSDCGDDYHWDVLAVPDMWHSLKIYVGRNSIVDGVVQPDGVQKVWLDGQLVFEKTDWIYDWTGEHLVDQLKFQNFHGGSDPAKFAPNKLQYVWVDDVAIQEGHCPPDSPPTFEDRTLCDHPPGSPSPPDPNPTPSTPAPDPTPPSDPSDPDVSQSPDTPSNPPESPTESEIPEPGKEVIMEAPPQCTPDWQPCANKSGKVAACCNAAAPCVRKNAHYAQCRPVHKPAPDTWDGELVQFL